MLDKPERVAEVLRETSRGYATEALTGLLLNTRRRLIRTV